MNHLENIQSNQIRIAIFGEQTYPQVMDLVNTFLSNLSNRAVVLDITFNEIVTSDNRDWTSVMVTYVEEEDFSE